MLQQKLSLTKDPEMWRSLNKKKDETLEDWKERVAIAKEELEAKRSAAYTETINSIDRIKNQRREDKEKEREETV